MREGGKTAFYRDADNLFTAVLQQCYCHFQPVFADILHRQQGRLVILSSPKKPVMFDFHDDCVWPSISIIGAHNFSHPDYPQVNYPWTKERHVEMFFDLVRLGKLDLADLVSRKVDFRRAAEAYNALELNRGGEMGIIIDWNQA